MAEREETVGEALGRLETQIGRRKPRERNVLGRPRVSDHICLCGGNLVPEHTSGKLTCQTCGVHRAP